MPVDVLPGPVPAEVTALATGAGGVFDAAAAQDWNAAGSQLDGLHTAWSAVQGGPVPTQIRGLIDGGLTALADAVGARDPAAAGQAAVDVLRLGLDLRILRAVDRADIAKIDVVIAGLEDAADAAVATARPAR